jgi:hypothetical protein
MVRGLLEKVLCPQTLDDLFERSAKTQYTRELLFSTVVNLISLVVCGIHPSIHAANPRISRGNRSFGHINLQHASMVSNRVSVRRRVKEIASQTEATIRHLNATMPDLLPGY